MMPSRDSCVRPFTPNCSSRPHFIDSQRSDSKQLRLSGVVNSSKTKRCVELLGAESGLSR